MAGLLTLLAASLSGCVAAEQPPEAAALMGLFALAAVVGAALHLWVLAQLWRLSSAIDALRAEAAHAVTPAALDREVAARVREIEGLRQQQLAQQARIDAMAHEVHETMLGVRLLTERLGAR
jgi:hypothetical protein